MKLLENIFGDKQNYKDWHIFRFFGYDLKAIQEMDEWLEIGPKGHHKKFGWRDDGCSTVTGVAIENDMDAMMFKLRFVGRSAKDSDDQFRKSALVKLNGGKPEGYYGDEEEDDDI